MEHFLLSIIPSENIAIRIRELRTLIFKEFGIVSSRCLPELIPAAFTMDSIGKDQFRGLALPELELTSSFMATVNKDLFLLINNSGISNTIRERIISPQISGIISVENGFYLGTAEKDSKIKDIISFLDSKIDGLISWKKNHLELIKIEASNDIWYENISWETEWTQKITLS